MNINAVGRHKLNEIIDSNINTNFDQACQDIVRLANALNLYQIDLGADVKGTLPASRLALPNPTGSAFLRDDGVFATPPSVDYLMRWCWQQNRSNNTTSEAWPTNHFGLPTGAPTFNTTDNTFAFVDYQSGALAGNTAGWPGSATAFARAEHFPTFEMRIRTGASISNVRFWIGLGTGWSAPNSDTFATGATAGFIGFRYSSATDTGWVGVTNNAATQTVSAQIAAITTSTIYRLKFRFVSAADVRFSVNGGTEVSITTNIPVTKDMSPGGQVVTTDAVAKVISMNRVYVLAN